MASVPSWTQIYYRFGADDGTGTATTAEANYTFSAAENTAITLAPTTTRILRISVQNDGTGSAGSFTTPNLQVRRNGGAYQDVTTVSTIVKTVASALITNDTATTNRLSIGAKTFLAGGVVSNDGTCPTVGVFAITNIAEFAFVIQVVSGDVINGDVLEFRMLQTSTVLNTYTVTPTITVNDGSGSRPRFLSLLGIS